MLKLKIFALGAAALMAMAMKPASDDFDTLIAAERRFAADASALGVTPAFRAHVAPDAVLISPTPRPAPPELATQTDPPGAKLEWQPEAGAIAKSGDLGFTTGPYVMRQGDRVAHGQYFTIWRKVDGTWRWVIDSGVAPFAKGEVSMPSQVVRIGNPGKAGAKHDLEAAERRLDADASSLAGFLAAEGRVLRSGGPPAIGDAGVMLAGRGMKATGKRLGGGQSAAGDLAYSYGEITGADGALIGHYVRMWLHEAAGWRLLVDQLAPLPRKAPPAS
ncbi:MULTISPECIES: nuclear transport factor 2 family protein [unclassified Sphingomonas]|uniref:nuclear transport factor 2 family protein n=1 Tax=unclassified Sphingomonas TaxID=196159 RepID=UPI0022B34549|nr:nuclear transport factor 2 family protein [Sphingomonas sp. NIBR02145]WHU01031.1 nuclear transport factor 2 family protein [Sphingomonas sp. NIBR02145]